MDNNFSQINNICVYGVGGVGEYTGGKIAHAMEIRPEPPNSTAYERVKPGRIGP